MQRMIVLSLLAFFIGAPVPANAGSCNCTSTQVCHWWEEGDNLCRDGSAVREAPPRYDAPIETSVPPRSLDREGTEIGRASIDLRSTRVQPTAYVPERVSRPAPAPRRVSHSPTRNVYIRRSSWSSDPDCSDWKYRTSNKSWWMWRICKQRHG